MNNDDLIVEAIRELKTDIKLMSTDIHSINKTLAALANVQSEIRDIKDEIKDLPVIRSKVSAMVWGISIIYISLVGFVVSNIR